MTTMVNIHEAKTHLSRFIERARAGEEIIIAKSGTPWVKLVPITDPVTRRQPGLAKGAVTDAFFEPLPDGEIQTWER
jgi:prevent-host-death family protein